MKQVIILFVILSSSLSSYAQDDLTATKAVTQIEFVEETFNFGEIENGEIVQNVYRFKNTGTEPLVITKAKGSCGCTVPEYPLNPIMPGKTANILVRFDSKGKTGNQSKRISIWANTEPNITYLTLRGKVLSKEETAIIADKRSKDLEMEAQSVTLFPNPSSDVLNVDISEYSGKSATLNIFDLQGKVLAARTINEIGDKISFDVAGLAGGVYTMSIKIDGMQRLAKQFTVVK